MSQHHWFHWIFFVLLLSLWEFLNTRQLILLYYQLKRILYKSEYIRGYPNYRSDTNFSLNLSNLHLTLVRNLEIGDTLSDTVKQELRATSWKLESTSWNSRVTSSSLQVTSSNPQATSSNSRVQESFNQWKSN